MPDLAPAKSKIISALATMPAEAFSWVVVALLPSSARAGGVSNIFPDGLGGFMPDSRASIEATQAAAQVYADLARQTGSDGR